MLGHCRSPKRRSPLAEMTTSPCRAVDRFPAAAVSGDIGTKIWLPVPAPPDLVRKAVVDPTALTSGLVERLRCVAVDFFQGLSEMSFPPDRLLVTDRRIPSPFAGIPLGNADTKHQVHGDESKV